MTFAQPPLQLIAPHSLKDFGRASYAPFAQYAAHACARSPNPADDRRCARASSSSSVVSRVHLCLCVLFARTKCFHSNGRKDLKVTTSEAAPLTPTTESHHGAAQGILKRTCL